MSSKQAVSARLDPRKIADAYRFLVEEWNLNPSSRSEAIDLALEVVGQLYERVGGVRHQTYEQAYAYLERQGVTFNTKLEDKRKTLNIAREEAESVAGRSSGKPGKSASEAAMVVQEVQRLRQEEPGLNDDEVIRKARENLGLPTDTLAQPDKDDEPKATPSGSSEAIPDLAEVLPDPE